MRLLTIDNLEEKRTKAKAICRLLMDEYGTRVHPMRLSPLDQLIITVLAQHTSDVSAERAYRRLKSDYPDWLAVMRSPVSDIIESIRESGLYNMKAKRIKSILTEIYNRVGSLDLSFLQHMEITDAKQWLTSLHGVGPKTASIVLLFSFNMPVIPVDTHVWRVTKRLGLISTKTSREKAHDILPQIITGDCVYSLNYNLVQHGRKVCRARNPQCAACVLIKYCDYYQKSRV